MLPHSLCSEQPVCPTPSPVMQDVTFPPLAWLPQAATVPLSLTLLSHLTGAATVPEAHYLSSREAVPGQPYQALLWATAFESQCGLMDFGVVTQPW